MRDNTASALGNAIRAYGPDALQQVVSVTRSMIVKVTCLRSLFMTYIPRSHLMVMMIVQSIVDYWDTYIDVPFLPWTEVIAFLVVTFHVPTCLKSRQ